MSVHGCGTGGRAIGGCVRLLLCVAVASCGTDTATRDSIDDLPRLRAVEDLRIGSQDDPDAGFSRLAAAAVDRDGNVFALEALDFQIRVYDPAGNLLRRIGRQGGGPGEFDGLPFYGLKGDTLWTYDRESGRITLFDRTGRVLATGRTLGFQVPVRTGYGFLTPHTMRPDGRLAGWFTRVNYARSGPPADSLTSRPIPRVLFDASGAVVDTVGWLSAPPPRMVPPAGYHGARSRSIKVGSQSYSVPDPPPELPVWEPLPDGHIIVGVPYARSAETGALTVTRISDAGDTVYRRTLRYRPQPYTEELLDAAAAQQPRAWMNGVEVTKPVDALVKSRLRAEMDFPAFRLPVQYSWLGADEGVWLRRTTDPGYLQHWIVLDAQGRLRGEVELPENARLLWCGGDVAWAAVPDDLDVPWLVRYRIGR